jgi:hypothetical protein
LAREPEMPANDCKKVVFETVSGELELAETLDFVTDYRKWFTIRGGR